MSRLLLQPIPVTWIHRRLLWINKFQPAPPTQQHLIHNLVTQLNRLLVSLLIQKERATLLCRTKMSLYFTNMLKELDTLLALFNYISLDYSCSYNIDVVVLHTHLQPILWGVLATSPTLSHHLHIFSSQLLLERSQYIVWLLSDDSIRLDFFILRGIGHNKYFESPVSHSTNSPVHFKCDGRVCNHMVPSLACSIHTDVKGCQRR